MKRLSIIVVSTLVLSACASTPTDRHGEAGPGILRVGVSPDAPPLIFKQNDRKISGLEAEMAVTLANASGKDSGVC
jgi:ABC-type amino acid transport substrate-binding protein